MLRLIYLYMQIIIIMLSKAIYAKQGALLAIAKNCKYLLNNNN